MSYYLYLDFKAAVHTAVITVAPITAIVAVFNMIFVHKGQTILFCIKDIDFTAEALLYGFSQGMLFAACVVWLILYGKVVGSDKLLSVFGRISANFALLFSMILGYVGRFRQDAGSVAESRAGLYAGRSEHKLYSAVKNFSCLMSMSLEGSIVTASSMKARGYNSSSFTYHRKIRFTIRDTIICIISVVCFALVISLKLNGNIYFIYEPVVQMSRLSPIGMITFSLTAFLPLILDAWEDILWQLSRRKI